MDRWIDTWIDGWIAYGMAWYGMFSTALCLGSYSWTPSILEMSNACRFTFFFCASRSIDPPTLRMSKFFISNIWSSPWPHQISPGIPWLRIQMGTGILHTRVHKIKHSEKSGRKKFADSQWLCSYWTMANAGAAGLLWSLEESFKQKQL